MTPKKTRFFEPLKAKFRNKPMPTIKRRISKKYGKTRCFYPFFWYEVKTILHKKNFHNSIKKHTKMLIKSIKIPFKNTTKRIIVLRPQKTWFWGPSWPRFSRPLEVLRLPEGVLGRTWEVLRPPLSPKNATLNSISNYSKKNLENPPP